MNKEFLEEWLSKPTWWFAYDLDVDKYVSSKWGHLMGIAVTASHDLDEKLACIVANDQLPRHYFRAEIANHIIQYFLQKALDIVQLIRQHELDALPIQKWIFAMLPRRHTNDIKEVYNVMKQAWSRLKTSDSVDLKLLKRFMKATYDKCPKEGAQRQLLRKYNSLQNKFEIPSAKRHPLVQTVHKSLLNSSSLARTKLVLSLSGGVDSMVLGFIVKSLGIDIIAVMVNYANRECSDYEESFVADWCTNHLATELNVRVINEVKREDCRRWELRDLYESYTRSVRYACYKDVIDNPVVLLGHNLDDCFENVLTNIVQQKKYDNLVGMTESCCVDGITFLRPMLSVSKKDIYSFAQEFDIPHLPDSTVTWCQRGMIRDHVKPVLTEWNDRCTPALFELSRTLSELHAVVECQVHTWVDRFKEHGEVQFTRLQELPTCKLFWRRLLHALTGVHVSQKSLSNLIDRFTKVENIKTMLIPIHKHISISIIVNANGIIRVVKPHSCPTNPCVQH
jgi:tRNA(Ile)-lysidine synthetase-like protein